MQGNAEVHFFEINYPIAEVTSGQKNSEVQNSDSLSSVFEPEALFSPTLHTHTHTHTHTYTYRVRRSQDVLEIPIPPNVVSLVYYRLSQFFYAWPKDVH